MPLSPMTLSHNSIRFLQQISPLPVKGKLEIAVAPTRAPPLPFTSRTQKTSKTPEGSGSGLAQPNSVPLNPGEPGRTPARTQTKNSLKGPKKKKTQGKTVSQDEDNGHSPSFGSPFHPLTSTRDVIVWTQCDTGRSLRRRIAFN